MPKIHVVRKQGYFKVEVAPEWTLPGRMRTFHSFEFASRYYRYHVSLLGWNYGVLRYVDNGDKPSQVLFSVYREV